MMFDEHELLRLGAEHQRYLDRMIPIIRLRLGAPGASSEQIDRYIAGLPTEHFRVAFNRATGRGAPILV